MVDQCVVVLTVMKDLPVHLPSSNDQVEESNLADGLDMTSKAWQVSIIDLILDKRMGPLTGSLSDSIRGTLHVLWVSTTGKYTNTGGNDP